MTNPYKDLPADRFWRTAVAERNFLASDDLWKPAIKVDPADIIVTAGSCFAQHIGRALAANGFAWTDFEPAPAIMTEAQKKKFNYGIFSFRTGNIYTTRLLKQWISWAFAPETASTEVWEQNGRFYDPFRPQIEPNGFASAKEMFRARENTLAAIKKSVQKANIFVFTFGLTEMWYNAETTLAYPTCPGTIAGDFDPEIHKFQNLTYPEIHADMLEVMAMMKNANPNIRFLLTVSPVPLTATAAKDHVLVATTYSKSVLRAVAGDLANAMDNVDYFPSFEIISSAPSRGMFFKPNMRTVAKQGVDFVMSHFFLGLNFTKSAPPDIATKSTSDIVRSSIIKDRNEDDLVCEEAVLEAYNEN